MKNKIGKIVKISGPLVEVTGIEGSKLFDLVKIGEEKLQGEVIEITVESTFMPLSVALGPGLIGSIYDGIQRPLSSLSAAVGTYLERGVTAFGLDLEKIWTFKSTVKKGDKVIAGDIIGEVKESSMITHKILVDYGIEGTIEEIKSGDFNIEEVIAVIKLDNGKLHNQKMYHLWPIRESRPKKEKMYPTKPLLTGSRVIDTFFPIMKGGVGNNPGPFGAGKTFLQHHISKYSDAQVVVYIGCGERGNEMTDILREFPHLKDPYTGKPLMEKVVMIANTSNMPIAAREAGVYVGMTIAEYYRDMGYDVTLLADSTSRWAEAMREISGRLEEMPGEEGYPAYLNSKIANFYERAGTVKCLGSTDSTGSITAIGAISPPGGDMSEPVTQATLKFSKCFWELSGRLANARHYPSVDWLKSYSFYHREVDEYCNTNIASDFSDVRKKLMQILKEEEKLLEIVRIVGIDNLSPKDRITIDTAKSIREDFLQQNAFVEVDCYTPLPMQYLLIKLISVFHDEALLAVTENEDINLDKLFESDLKEFIGRAKTISQKDKKKIEDKIASMKEEVSKLAEETNSSDNMDLVDTVNSLSN